MRLVQLASMGLVAVSAAAMLTVQQDTPAQATETGSAVTLNWAGDNADSLQQYQPERDPKSIHYDDFDRLSVSVSQTRDLTDQVVQVRVAGFDGPTVKEEAPGDPFAEDGTNFVQAMQCWGDPAAADFYKNCLWGGWASGYPPLSGKEKFAGGVNAGTDMRGTAYVDIPFRTAQGTEIASLPVGARSPMQEWYSWANTNEEVKQLVSSDGVAAFDFELQAAAAAPQLGCGRESERCWLVIVPRGSHTTAATSANVEAKEGCPIRADLQGTKFQVGSPINPACDYWRNRVVVPLDFRPVTQACALGSAERRTVGNELVMRAFNSWQPALCETNGTAYSFAPVADLTARSQLLAGQAGLAFVNKPLTNETVSNEAEVEQLAETEIIYAPVAISALTIAYQANSDGVIPASVKLTPRLLAKLLTHSYTYQQIMPLYFWGVPEGQWSKKQNNTNRTLADDPEFQALNGDQFSRPSGNIILTGPNGADAIELLWRYVQADGEARAFLTGEADPWGMTVNPYYLPSGHTDAKVPEFVEKENPTNWFLIGKGHESGEYSYRGVGLNYDLSSTAPQVFPKAEETLGPQTISKSAQQTRRFDITQSAPYAADYSSVARLIFTGDNNSKTLWDTSKFNSAGEVGDYVSTGRSFSNQVFMTGVTDSATASGYSLPTAQLQTPNQSGVFTSADATGMRAALNVQAPTGVAGIGITDPSAVANGVYPLTLVSYAAVNLTNSDSSSRDEYASLIEYAADAGQVQGSARGQLPVGYLPLSEDLRKQTLAAASAIRAWQPGSTTAPTVAPAPQTASPTPAPAPSQASPNPQTSVTAAPTKKGGETDAVLTAGNLAIGGSLLAGLAGVLGAPFLLKRRPL